MIFKHVTEDCSILELGPNIGRSSLVANFKLKDKTKHLCVETGKEICTQLKENRNINNAKFKIFEGGISNKPLYQKGWRTQTTPAKGYKKVNTITLNELLKRNNHINFNTIIADCEGCIVSILNENQDFLNQINLIILEHDFNNENELKIYNNLMKKYNFKLAERILKKDVGLENWESGPKLDPIFVSVWKKY